MRDRKDPCGLPRMDTFKWCLGDHLNVSRALDGSVDPSVIERVETERLCPLVGAKLKYYWALHAKWGHLSHSGTILLAPGGTLNDIEWIPTTWE